MSLSGHRRMNYGLRITWRHGFQRVFESRWLQFLRCNIIINSLMTTDGFLGNARYAENTAAHPPYLKKKQAQAPTFPTWRSTAVRTKPRSTSFQSRSDPAGIGTCGSWLHGLFSLCGFAYVPVCISSGVRSPPIDQTDGLRSVWA